MLNAYPSHDSPDIRLSIIVDCGVQGLNPKASYSQASPNLESELISELVVDDLLGRICRDDKLGGLLVVVLSRDIEEFRGLVRLQHVKSVGSGCDDSDGHCGSCVLRSQLVGLSDRI